MVLLEEDANQLGKMSKQPRIMLKNKGNRKKNNGNTSQRGYIKTRDHIMKNNMGSDRG